MRSGKEKNRINEVVESAIKNIGGLVNVDMVVGTPIKTDDGDVIIPVSKVTFGILSGGGEYGKVNIFKSGSDLPYSAGNGAVVSVKPCGFLLKNDNSDYKLLSVSGSPVETFVNKVTDYISNLGETDDEPKA